MAPLPVIAPRPEASDLVRTLTGLVRGEVRLGRHDRMLYATDASLYQAEPLGVVIPADVEDAAEALRQCARLGLAVLPRGGGTSLAGQCTNHAVVIDTSVNCRAIVDVDATNKRCRVEPGITVDDLNDRLSAMGGAVGGLFFAPDPATSRHANIGGCIGNNAAGARSIRYGRTSENVRSVDVALADGTRARLGPGGAGDHERVRAITRGVCEIALLHAGEIRARFPKTVRRNAGYGLDMILAQLDALGVRPGAPLTDAVLQGVNLAPLLCGSEGTLAMTLGAELLLHDKPRAKGLAVLGFDSLDGAIEAVVPILSTRPSAVELLDDTVIDLARANTEYRRYVDLMPQPAKGTLAAVLYVEYFGASPEEIAASFDGLRRVMPHASGQFHTDAGAMLSAWKLRKAGEPLLHGIPGHRKPITFIEDNAVPVERLAEFVKRLRAIVASQGTRAAFYAHASVGVLHVRPLLDVHDPADRDRLRAIAVETADLARELGGVMSGEHGDGRVRTPLLERHFGPALMGAFAEVKRLFDPSGVLNPGNIVQTTGEPPRTLETMTQSLRVEPLGRPVGVPQGVETYFDYTDQHGLDGAVEMCNGAGVCRKKQGGTMCPSYMATLDERHSTRGRGNALRLAITGQLGPDPWNDPDTKATLDLCLSCKACKTECPSNVDIARLKAEYTAQGHRTSARVPLRARVFGAARWLNRVGAIAPGVANAVNAWAPVRALLGAALGLHPRRSLPQFARPLTDVWKPVPPGTGRPRVVLFGDCFTMFNEPGIGLATRTVLEAFGYDITLANAGCCGRAKISTGLLAEATREIDSTLDHLAPLARDPGVVAILVAEPSCLSAMKDDWLALKLGTPTEARRAVAAKAFLPEQFLDRHWDTHPTRPNFRQPEGEVILHGHCHQKALWGAESSAGVLRRVFGGKVRVLDTGCCGMAGSFGFTRERFDLSMKIGELALLPAVRRAGPGDAIVAPGTSCRHQIHDGAARRAEHPMEVLAEHLMLDPTSRPHASMPPAPMPS